MIFHDKVQIRMEVPTGEEDAHGNPIVDITEADTRAEVFPLDTANSIDQSGRVISRYRMVLRTDVDIPSDIGSALTMRWSGFSGVLLVDGTVERHMLRGRLHHYELITKAVT
ncbi:hypothetical protein BTZ20_4463 [Rhodococcus sp. MTM3W5.2]|uniref:hypothetical protein n=1 Tax=Rhodococcus sp. MTM3W5.2 TaxID=1805827 RepID=UPI0009794C86|nr:hypothetical protein [Rhodococcus sp. MTM3W5.2]AQA24530.1 hypothetical protein BTZ20_4463 [Rhodococcus sp. MTM3W5.2]